MKFDDSTSPIERLPPELLFEIWSILCDRNAIKPTAQVPELPAFALSMVCSTWRAVALSSPSLWASFQVRLVANNVAQAKLDGMLHLLSRYLSNSKQSPLKLDLCIHASESSGNSDNLSRDTKMCQIIDCILQESYRWCDVTLDLALLDRDSQFPRIRGCVPLLESVTLRFDRHGIVTNLFQSSPKLHTLVSSGVWDIDLPQQQLEFLHFLGSGIERLQQYVSSSSNLQQLVCYADFDKVGLQRGIITSTSLRSLTVFTQTVWDREIPLWNLFTFPNLQELTIWMSRPSRREKPLPALSVQDISAFLTRSACQVTTLSVLSLQDLEDARKLISLFSLLPSLVTLVIHEERGCLGSTSLTEIINLLHFPPRHHTCQAPSGTCMCTGTLYPLPKLQNIELAINSDVIRLLLGSIKGMIESRVHSPIPAAQYVSISALQNVSLIIWDRDPDVLRKDHGLFDALHSLKHDGLAFSVYYK